MVNNAKQCIGDNLRLMASLKYLFIFELRCAKKHLRTFS